MSRQRRTPILLPEWRRNHLPGVPSKVLRDEEVHAFIEDQLKRPATFGEIARACLAKFGPERAPARSSIHRYWVAYHRPDRAPRA